MQLISVEEIAGLKYYRLLNENGDPFIAEPLFTIKKPKSRVVAGIVREIEGIIKKRRELIEHPGYIIYEGIELINDEYCLLRRGEEIYQPLDSNITGEKISLEEVADWIISLGELACDAEKAGITWPVIFPNSLYLSKDKSMKMMDPDISIQLLKYREPEDANLMEIYLAPEVFRENIRISNP